MPYSKGRSHPTITVVFKGETILGKHVHRVHYSETIIKNCGVTIISNESSIGSVFVNTCKLHAA